MLSEQIKKRLSWEDGGRKPQSPEQVMELFQAAGLTCHRPVAEVFATFGGGRFCLVETLHTPLVQIDRFKTKCGILYAKDVVRELKSIQKRHPDQFEGYNDPARFRVTFAEYNRAIEALTLDGHGQVYEGISLLAPSVAAWLEGLAQK